MKLEGVDCPFVQTLSRSEPMPDGHLKEENP